MDDRLTVTLTTARQVFTVSFDGDPVSSVEVELQPDGRWHVHLGDDTGPLPGVRGWWQASIARDFEDEREAQDYANHFAVSLARSRIALARATEVIHAEHLAQFDLRNDGAEPARDLA